MSAVDNPPAFPRTDLYGPDGCGLVEGSPGMTLRDWFAGQAIGAIIAATSAGQHKPVKNGKAVTQASIEAGIAEDAYTVADAMLAERAKAGAA